MKGERGNGGGGEGFILDRTPSPLNKKKNGLGGGSKGVSSTGGRHKIKKIMFGGGFGPAGGDQDHEGDIDELETKLKYVAVHYKNITCIYH